MSRFVHLHTHSHYSLLEALPKVKELLKHVGALEQKAVALTDNGTLYGAIEFYQKAIDAGIKPIIGVDFYVAQDSRHLKRARIDTRPNRLVCLAQNQIGYKNLIQLSSLGFLEGFYYKPRIDKELIQKFSNGLIALSGGHMGEIDELLKLEKVVEAKEAIRWYVSMFGEGNYFLELVDRPEIAEQEATNTRLIELGKELGVPLVATKNTFYLKPQDTEAWKILNCIKGGKTLEQFERMNQYEYDASMVSGEYMEGRFRDCPEAIENTHLIADRCEVTLELGKWNFPKFEIEEGKTFRQVLTDQAFSKLKERRKRELDEVEIKRLNYELEIIDQKGFCPYLLIVSDFLTWSNEHGIVTTTRGSAAGSLVSYSIGISSIDPLLYQLPFERFLNPERPSAPDIDADFADNRRDEVLDYVRGKYGHEKVAQICTFGTMLARGSVRDVGRALGFPYGMIDEVAKLVPMGSQGFPMTLERALKEAPDLRKKYDTDANIRRVIDLAQRIEGCARHVSIHAAGTVISPTDLTDFTPLQIDTKEGKIITQYEMHAVESAGLVKMDFLGIRNLSILGDAVALVRAVKGIEVVTQDIPVGDKKTFELLATGHTMGVFQLNGDGMTKYLMDLRPERVEDIMAMVALYRPGPIEVIPEYIRRKHDASLVKFMDTRMEEFLQKSYGLLVYQDDVMLTAIHLAGYSWLEADKLRKAMGKKIPEEMALQKVKLVDGFVEHGMTKAQATELWKLIEPFAAYGFNKAHAASYGMVAYQTAYMKANFPAEYMTALMTAESGDLEKIAEAVKECGRMGIAVLSPDINESRKDFTFMSDTQIRFGLLVIKNLGEEVVESIITERKSHGPFKHLADFAGRISHRAFNKKSLEALIKVGALDRFGERKQLFENIDRILLHNKAIQREKASNQQSLFAGVSVMSHGIVLRDSPPATTRELLAWEKELLGLYVSAHPYDPFAVAFKGHLLDCACVVDQKDGVFARVGGIITSVKEIITKKGDPMVFVGLEDLTGSTEVIVFPRTYIEAKTMLSPDRIVLVSAKVSARDGEEKKLLANSFIEVDETNIEDVVRMLKDGQWVTGDVRQEMTPKDEESPPAILHRGSLSIALKGKPTQEMVASLREILTSTPGPKPVCLMVESGGQMRRIQTDYSVAATDSVVSAIAALVGRQNVSVE
ncbi:DNA polymerase III subunit alpha [Patescibacteria group bacterium]|nr:MAG: DNA polymerase III subunit alpha [Patescibacteria group bacterium]